jgi:type IV secretion system protein VirB9
MIICKKFSFESMKFMLLIIFLLIASNSYGQNNIPLTTDSRIRTLVYNPNEVYEIKFFYGYQSFLEFSEDEEIEMISVGEGFAWRLTPIGRRLFVRPLEISAHTNMIITTNRRTYHFDIRSSDYSGKSDEELVYTVRFFYPQVGQTLPIPPQLSVPNRASEVVKPKVVDAKSNYAEAKDDSKPNNIADVFNKTKQENYNYSFVGNDKIVTPLKIYDDGEQTMIQFINNNESIPEINIVDNDGGEQKLNYVIKNGLVIVPAVASQFSFRLNQGIICVFNNNIINNLRPQ